MNKNFFFRDQTKMIKEGEDTKTKSYSALCYCYVKIYGNDIEKINAVRAITISQKTPIRVLHR